MSKFIKTTCFFGFILIVLISVSCDRNNVGSLNQISPFMVSEYSLSSDINSTIASAHVPYASSANASPTVSSNERYSEPNTSSLKTDVDILTDNSMETSDFLSMMATYCSSQLSIRWENPIRVCSRFEVGTVINMQYTTHSILEADEYKLTCKGERVTLISTAECKIENNGSYKLEFIAPESGKGKITLTLTALKNGKVLDKEVQQYLYWTSCDLGVYVSGSEIAAELMMAKAQFDAGEISAKDYEKILRSQQFFIDINLMNMLSKVGSSKIELSRYAAPYVEALHNRIFGIESDVVLPTVSETLQKMKDESGIDKNSKTSVP